MESRAIPRSPSQAAAYAMLETLRVRIAAAARTSHGISSVLSVNMDAFDVDIALAGQLVTALGIKQYHIVGPSSYFTRIVQRGHELLSVLHHAGDIKEFVDSPAASETASAVQYDLILLPAWRLGAPWGTDENAAKQLFSKVFKVLAPGGAVVVCSYNVARGAFRLRQMLHAQAEPSSHLTAWLPPLFSTATTTSKTISCITGENGLLNKALIEEAVRTTGMPLYFHSDSVDSQVDITDLLGDVSTPAALSVLSELMGCEPADIAALDSSCVAQYLAQVQRSTLFNVRQRDGAAVPVYVHTPLEMVFIADSRHVKVERKRYEVRKPRGVGAFSVFDVVTGLLTPFMTGEDDVEQVSAVRSSLPLVLPPMNILTNVPGYTRRLADGRIALDFKPIIRHASIVEAAPAADPSHNTASEKFDTAEFDQWYPHGDNGGFCNVGLATWVDQRTNWTARPQGYRHPPYPPIIDSDDLIDELADITREVELPGPIRLPDMIDMFLEVWSPISDDDSDPEW